MYHQKSLLGTLVNGAHPLSKGLVGAWLFNENSGNKVFDLSGNGNHGTFGAGAATPTWIAGRNGSALDFDGGDYVDCGNNASLNITDAITIVSEIYVTSGVITDAYIISKNSTGATDAQYSIWRQDSSNRLRTYLNGTSVASSAVDSILEGQRCHIAMVWNKIDVRHYVNGLLSGTPSAYTTSLTQTNFTVNIGRRKPDNLYFNGTINDLWIYNRALSTSEIWQLYVDPYCMFAQPMQAELFYEAPPVGAIINQFQKANLGADLYDGVLIT